LIAWIANYLVLPIIYQEQGIDSGIPPINDSLMESEEAEGQEGLWL
jgi:hypothetical protein